MEVRREALHYFSYILEDYEVNSASPDTLHEHLKNASKEVRSYFNSYHSGSSFKNFFEEEDCFFVSEEGFVSLAADVENDAVEYFEDIFENNTLDLVHHSDVKYFIEEEDSYVADYIDERYPDEDLVKFFENHRDIFSVANGYVVLLSERDLECEEYDTVEYLSTVVKQYNGYFRVHELKQYALLNEEGRMVMELINDCYPGDDFAIFLENSDVFLIDYEGAVYLKSAVDQEAAMYFKDIMVSKMYHPVHYTKLYGHIGQAQARVMKYINEEFGRRGFLQFLKSRGDVFNLRQLGFVSYIGTDAAVYFARVLENYYYDMPHYLTLRDHIGQAPGYIARFINAEYSGEKFYDFLLEYKLFFDIDEGGYVSHSSSYKDLHIL